LFVDGLCILGPVRTLSRQHPVSTAFMEQRAAVLGRPVRYRWVAYNDVPVSLRRAVVAGEDVRFFEHGGLDRQALWRALRDSVSEGRIVRGGSTISQQLAKNLFLSAVRTPLRKVREGVITLELEWSLDKWRILELYLNVIEWGDGIFGCAAAAEHHFSKDVRVITEDEALTLAAVIPLGGKCDPLSECAIAIHERRRRIARLLGHPAFGVLLAPASQRFD
jgi:monofunctional biosynthetic peptidoglycan transglycosylase